MMMYIDVPLFLLLLVDSVEDHARSDKCGTKCFQAKFAVSFFTNGVVDSTHDLFHLKYLFRNLAGHDITIVAVGYGGKGIGVANAGAHQHIFINAIADEGGALKVRAEALKGVAGLVDD